MQEFSPGEQKIAVVPMTNPTARAFDYVAELYMGAALDLMASVPFHLDAGESKDVRLPVTMPSAAGTYPVNVAVFSEGEFLPPVHEGESVVIAKLPPAKLYIRPNAPGSYTQWLTQYPGSGAHWDKCDDPWDNPDDASTYIQHANEYQVIKRDTYNLESHGAAQGTINYIKVHLRVWNSHVDVYFYAIIVTHGTRYEEPTISGVGGATWRSGSKQWTNNPYTEVAWTWAEIDALQAGIRDLHGVSFCTARCTQ
ncbi:unnamed protein product, partial [marine sediment metagenome]